MVSRVYLTRRMFKMAVRWLSSNVEQVQTIDFCNTKERWVSTVTRERGASQRTKNMSARPGESVEFDISTRYGTVVEFEDSESPDRNEILTSRHNSCFANCLQQSLTELAIRLQKWPETSHTLTADSRECSGVTRSRCRLVDR